MDPSARRFISKSPSKVSDLKESPRNPRTITDERLEMLQKSMSRFGDLGAIVFNRETGRLVGGHQRSKKLPGGAKIVIDHRYKKPTQAGTVAEGHVEFDGERFKYREVAWDEATERAANLAANKHGGTWDMKMLVEELNDLDAMNIDMSLTGFTNEDIENIMAPPAKAEIVTFEAKKGASELNPDGFSNLEHKCPKCGFEFDGEG